MDENQRNCILYGAVWLCAFFLYSFQHADRLNWWHKYEKYLNLNYTNSIHSRLIVRMTEAHREYGKRRDRAKSNYDHANDIERCVDVYVWIERIFWFILLLYTISILILFIHIHIIVLRLVGEWDFEMAYNVNCECLLLYFQFRMVHFIYSMKFFYQLWHFKRVSNSNYTHSIPI